MVGEGGEETAPVRKSGTARRAQRELVILEHMQRIGPDVTQISKMTGIPRETVRYLYKEHILKKRIRVQREIDHEKLGLSYIEFLVKFPSEVDRLFDPRQGPFAGLWENIYSSSIYRIIPDNYRFIGHLAPPSLHPRLEQFYEKLEKIGLCRVIERYHADHLVHAPMWVEKYDIERNAWDFDWEVRGKKRPPIAVESPVSEPVELDRTDLEIVSLQQMDPQASMSSLAAKMKMKQPTFAYHWREHITGRGFYKGWYVRWLGTHLDPKTGLILRRHSSAAINVLARDLSPVEMMNFRAQLHSIPFLWGEQIGTHVGEVNAETLVPGNELVDYFDFLGKITAQLQDKVRIMMVDQQSSSVQALHPHLFDESRGGWFYMGDLILDALEKGVSDYALPGKN
jgi:hypothetical protein